VEPVRLWDPCSIIFTSGTTGPSKAVVAPYAQIWAQVGYCVIPTSSADDVHLLDLPMFHVGGLMALESMLAVGGSIVMTTGFSASTYWEVATRYGVTRSTMVSAMANFLWKTPPSAFEGSHRIRSILMTPVVANLDEWTQRFGVGEIWTMFNMSEVSSPICTMGMDPRSGTCGRPRPGVEVRIVDEHDVEVATGSVGELVIRTDRPWELCLEYKSMPEATAAAWRNGWFHTGDALRVDAEGRFFYVDRLKDSIRRRGENVSSFEVEASINTHEMVLESAVVPIPSEDGEDEIKACVVLRDPALSPSDLYTYLKDRLPHFMIPRFVEFVDELPKTPTNKTRKSELKDRGLTPATWDAEESGVRPSRSRPRTAP
jgi:crotonobetaine/carnitine-CoA ligase